MRHRPTPLARAAAWACALPFVITSVEASGPAGAVAGTVRTPEGSPVPQLVLVLTGPGGERSLATGPEGRFRAGRLAPGSYTIAVDAPGFALAAGARAEVADAEVHLDLVVAPAPVREHVVVSATRGDAAASTLGVGVTAVDGERIAEREAPTLLHVLEEVPGVSVARAGGQGLQASAFVRGGESRFARVLVDGVPVNEPGGYYNFGSALPLELERVEVVRGAASSLYGTDALAGVIHLVTRRAAPGEAASLHGEAEAGGFARRRFQGGSSGRRGRLDWNVGALRLTTDNQEPNSRFEQTAAAASLGLALGARTDARLLARGGSSGHGTPGPTAFGRPDRDARYDRDDLVLGAHLRHGRGPVSHELHAGFSQARQLSLNPASSGTFTARWGDAVGDSYDDFPDPEGFRNDTRRVAAGYEAEVQAGGRQLVTLGADVERESGEIGDGPTRIDAARTNVGAYLQDRVVAGARVFVTLGGRLERNDSFGTRLVPRAAVAWRVRPGADATTLRASAGLGIKEPSFFESFGVSIYARGNPDLKPERSRTLDAGVEQRLLGGRLRGELTLFHHGYRDQIAYQSDPHTYQGTYVNLGQTRARGLELALEAAPAPGLRVAAQYTYLDGRIQVSGGVFDRIYAAGRPLLRRPKHAGTLTAAVQRGRVGVGATVVYTGRRADSDFVGLGLLENEPYTRVDARARVRLGAGVEAFAVAENLLDREYQEVLGFPALGRSVRGGLRLRTGGAAARP